MFSQTVKKNMKILGLSVENSCLWKKKKCFTNFTRSKTYCAKKVLKKIKLDIICRKGHTYTEQVIMPAEVSKPNLWIPEIN